MGRPVVMPDANIAHLFRDGADAVLLQVGNAGEIATKCIELFSNPERADEIGRAGRRVAEKYFDVRIQARQLENIYENARKAFNPAIAAIIWRNADENTAVSLLLAKKLRLLADSDGENFAGPGTGIIREHARYMELVQQRLTGLDTSLAEHARQIATLNQTIIDLRKNEGWKLTSPLPTVKNMLKRLSKVTAQLKNAK
jgi:hypothetical protein